jgi:U3 small nucleolar RNA-associated protein 14
LAGEPYVYQTLTRKERNSRVEKSSLTLKSKAALKKQLARTKDALSREADDAVVEISLDKAMTIDHAKQKPMKKSKQEGKEKTKEANPVVDPAFRNSDDEGDDAEGEGVEAFEQRDLVALAFAGDNVVEVRSGRVL